MMVRTYLRVEPTREQVAPAEMVKRIEGLRKLEDSLTSKLDPRSSPPVFEFLILTRGGGEEVKFYWGVDDESHLRGLQSELTAALPDSYDIYEEAISLRGELTPTDYPGTDDSQNPLDAVQTEQETETENLPATVDDLSIEDFEESIPKSVCWYGVEDRRKDWMTTLKEFEEQVDNSDDQHARSPLASAVENLSQTPVPVALQVVFTRKKNWEKKAERRKNMIRAKMDTPGQMVKTAVFDQAGGLDDEERRERHRPGDATDIGESAFDHEKETGMSIRSRSALIDRKMPGRTFTANLRASALIPDPFPNGTEESVETDLRALGNAFNLVDGPMYSIQGELVDESSLSRKTSESVFENLLERSITRNRIRKKRPQLVLNASELANFISVPSLEALTSEGARGTRGEGKFRTPLELPDPDVLDRFRSDGVKLTYPLNQRGQTTGEPVCLPFNALNQHFTIAARSGGGKSKLTQTILKSLAEETRGPNVAFNPKDDFMFENYMRGHYKAFGSLDDVIYFDVDENLPCIPFFDIRPLLAAGNSREGAIEYKKKQFKDTMIQAMGEERYGQAFVGVTILNLLIEALFDPIHGSDAFTLDDLREALNLVSDEGRVPEVSERFSHVENELTRYLHQSDNAKDSFEAAENRLAVISNQHKLRKFFNQLPEWDDENDCYVDEGFHFTDLLHTDKTILFDIGRLHAETQRVLTTVILTNIWDAVRFRNHQRTAHDSTPDNYCTNIIIDEAAELASTRIVSKNFLPQGRGYDVGLGLIEQFPDQVGQDKQEATEEKQRAYREMVNNVHTKLIGNIAITDTQAELLAFEGVDKVEVQKRINDMAPGEWFTELPSPEHFQNPPKPFYSRSPPILPGHPESNDPLTDREEIRFQEQELRRVVERTKQNYSTQTRRVDDQRRDQPGSGEPDRDVDPTGAGISDMFQGEMNAPSADSGQSASQSGTSAEGSSSTEHVDLDGFMGGEDSGDEQESRPPEEAKQTATNESPGGSSEEEIDRLDWASDGGEVRLGNDAESENESPADYMQMTSSPSADEPETFRQQLIPDEDLASRGLERIDVRFLGLVHDAMQDDVPGYSLLDPMSNLPLYDEANIDRLLELGLLEESRIGPRRYFSVTPDGRDLLGEDRSFGAGVGDLGEKIQHIVGVRLLAAFFEQTEQIDHVELYYEYNDVVIDVAAFSSGRSDPVWVAEVETDTNDRASVRHDYQKMEESPAAGTWLVDSKDTLDTILTTLSQHEPDFEPEINLETNPSYSQIRTELAETDDTGITRVYGYSELFSEVK